MIRSCSQIPGLLLAVLFGIAAAHAGEWKEIGLDVAVPPRIETTPGQTVLVARFRANDHERIDIGLEIARWVRREVARRTALRALDVPPPPIPEQRPEKLAVNDAFWRQLGEDFGADIIVSGVAEYEVTDRSGFVTVDLEDPVTFQTVRRTRYVERRGFRIKLEVFVLQGDNGALLDANSWSEERIVDGTSAEDLQMLFDSLELAADDLRGTFVPTTVKEPRFIWVE